VDVRTRLDAEIETLDPARFFGAELPAALDAADALLVEALTVLRLPPLVVEVRRGQLDTAGGRRRRPSCVAALRPGTTR